MGTNFWWHSTEYIKKNHMFLQKITKKEYFKMPYSKESSSYVIACTSFPRWGFCQNCDLLQLHKDSPPGEKGFFCKECTKGARLLPARLVIVCKQGHLDDFPWNRWAHSDSNNPVPVCKEPKLYWKGGRHSGSISNFRVECANCGATNSMFGATSKDGIQLYDEEKESFVPYSCTGELPWLQQQKQCKKTLDDGKQDDKQTETAIGVIARATSLYYSKIIRGIIIPQLAHPIVKYLQSEECKTRIQAWRDADIDDDKKIAELILKGNNDFKEEGYTKEQIFDFMNKLDTRNSNQEVESEIDLKKIEYEDLLNNKDWDEDKQVEKEIVLKNIELTDKMKEYFQDIRQLPILTALEVPMYFTRLTPPGDVYSDNQNFHHNICQLQVTGKTKFGQPMKRPNWLPCVIKKGEGIFLVFNKNFIKKCMTGEMKERLDSLVENHKIWEKESRWPSAVNIDPQYILLHSISHILIKELALQSGYNEASMSERIYSSENMCGLLIYTTSSGDGSLGGLVRQAEHNMMEIIENAFLKAKTCSRDPICILEDPKVKRRVLPLHLSQNGSACYGCMLLPETSCENFNKMLDRKVLVDENFGMGNRILK